MAGIKDYRHYQQQRELKTQRAHQDRELATRHAQFDLQAQDNHMKYERPSFIVVTASDAFREGWDNIFGKKEDTGGKQLRDDRVCNRSASKGD